MLSSHMSCDKSVSECQISKGHSYALNSGASPSFNRMDISRQFTVLDRRCLGEAFT